MMTNKFSIVLANCFFCFVVIIFVIYLSTQQTTDSQLISNKTVSNKTTDNQLIFNKTVVFNETTDCQLIFNKTVFNGTDCQLIRPIFDKIDSRETNKTCEEELWFSCVANQHFAVDGLTGDNVTGFSKLIVPNIIHYILFHDHILSFVHFVSIKSVLRNHRPDTIMIHCDCDELEGPYWDRLLAEGFGTIKLVMRRIDYPDQVFGIPLNPEHRPWHASDIMRPRILMEFGGFYLDRDVYVVKSLDVFRKYEMTVVMEGNQMASGVQIAHKNARFLDLYLALYKHYDGYWVSNSGILPTKRIINKHPHLVHLVTNDDISVKPKTCRILFQQNSLTWQDDYFMVHLFIRGNSTYNNDWCLDPSLPRGIMEFNEDNIKQVNITFGQMARLIFYNTTDFV